MKRQDAGIGMSDFGIGILWGYPQDFLLVWDVYEDRNSVPTAALVASRLLGDCAAGAGGGVLRYVCLFVCLRVTMRYDTRCYFNVRSKADMSQLNLPHGTDN